MAENIIVVMNKDDLQPLANDIKTLNGLNQSNLITLDEMEKAIEDANDAVNSQSNLIAQISAALEGKAAGGGEDVSAETAEYTSLLTDLETAIDALPEAGSGGSSSEMKIATGTVQSAGVHC